MPGTKTAIFVFSLLLLTNLKGLGQKLDNWLAFSGGLSTSYLKDEALSPLNNTANGQILSLEFYSKNPKRLFYASLSYNHAKVTNSVFEDFSTISNSWDANISYYKAFGKNSNKVFHIYPGVEFQTRGTYVDFEEGDGFSYMVGHGLNAALHARADFSKKQLLMAFLSFPLLSYISRPPFAGFDEFLEANPIRGLVYEGGVRSLDKYQAIYMDLAYGYKLSDKFYLNGNYRMAFLNLADDEVFRSLSHIFELGLIYNLK